MLAAIGVKLEFIAINSSGCQGLLSALRTHLAIRDGGQGLEQRSRLEARVDWASKLAGKFLCQGLDL